MIYLVIGCFIGLIYVAWRAERIEGLVRVLVAAREQEEELKKSPKAVPAVPFLPDEWTDRAWTWKSRQEERRALENPNILRSPDKFLYAEILTRFGSITEPLDKISFLTSLKSHGTYFNEELAAAVFRDRDTIVRAWGAANLETEFRDYRHYDYTKGETAPVVADFEEELKRDSEPLVRASIWRNRDSNSTPWGMFRVTLKESWIEDFKSMSELDRLALMHNGRLSFRFLIALFKAGTAELGITREEHAQLLLTGTQNSEIVLSSRHYGREVWAYEDDANPPFEEYGEMWDCALEHWKDQAHVMYSVVKYIQTTPQVKLRAYEKLLGFVKGQYLRQALIEGCDPFTDSKVLKAVWDDPDEECRKTAREVVGRLKDIVGVK